MVSYFHLLIAGLFEICQGVVLFSIWELRTTKERLDKELQVTAQHTSNFLSEIITFPSLPLSDSLYALGLNPICCQIGTFAFHFNSKSSCQSTLLTLVKWNVTLVTLCCDPAYGPAAAWITCPWLFVIIQCSTDQVLIFKEAKQGLKKWAGNMMVYAWPPCNTRNTNYCGRSTGHTHSPNPTSTSQQCSVYENIACIILMHSFWLYRAAS